MDLQQLFSDMAARGEITVQPGELGHPDTPSNQGVARLAPQGFQGSLEASASDADSRGEDLAREAFTETATDAQYLTALRLPSMDELPAAHATVEVLKAEGVPLGFVNQAVEAVARMQAPVSDEAFDAALLGARADLEARLGDGAAETIKAGWSVLDRLIKADPALAEGIDRLLSDRRTAAWAIETAANHGRARAGAR